MAPKKTPLVDNNAKINFPGVQLKELLELEDTFGDLRMHLTLLAVPIIIIAQIRALCPEATPTEILGLESVNCYIRNLLSNTYSMRYVGATIALRRSLLEFANDESTVRLKSTWQDLVDNPSGKSSTKGSIKAAMTSPDRLRAYRRGMMLQLVGNMQSLCIYSHRRISSELEKISANTLALYLPFNTDDIKFDEIFNALNKKLDSNGGIVNFVDGIDSLVNAEKVIMEEPLNIKREGIFKPEVPTLSEAEFDALPNWKRIAYKQSKAIK